MLGCPRTNGAFAADGGLLCISFCGVTIDTAPPDRMNRSVAAASAARAAAAARREMGEAEWDTTEPVAVEVVSERGERPFTLCGPPPPLGRPSGLGTVRPPPPALEGPEGECSVPLEEPGPDPEAAAGDLAPRPCAPAAPAAAALWLLWLLAAAGGGDHAGLPVRVGVPARALAPAPIAPPTIPAPTPAPDPVPAPAAVGCAPRPSLPLFVRSDEGGEGLAQAPIGDTARGGAATMGGGVAFPEGRPKALATPADPRDRGGVVGAIPPPPAAALAVPAVAAPEPALTLPGCSGEGGKTPAASGVERDRDCGLPERTMGELGPAARRKRVAAEGVGGCSGLGLSGVDLRREERGHRSKKCHQMSASAKCQVPMHDSAAMEEQ